MFAGMEEWPGWVAWGESERAGAVAAGALSRSRTCLAAEATRRMVALYPHGYRVGYQLSATRTISVTVTGEVTIAVTGRVAVSVTDTAAANVTVTVTAPVTVNVAVVATVCELPLPLLIRFQMQVR